jgi:hypothetical protein
LLVERRRSEERPSRMRTRRGARDLMSMMGARCRRVYRLDTSAGSPLKSRSGEVEVLRVELMDVR